MASHFKTIITLVVFLLSVNALWSQPEFKYGLGLGVNFTSPKILESYPLYEDLTGGTYKSEYSPLLSNIGNQYFFHAELWFNKFIVAIKPGTYTQKFSSIYEVGFNTETVEVENSFTIRYLSFPVEAKYVIGNSGFKTFLGGSASYGHQLSQSGAGNNSFIRPKFTAGPVAGAYYSFPSFELNLSIGYDFGLHGVTKKTERYSTSSITPFSQSNLKLNSLYATLSVLFSISKKETKGSLGCPQIPVNAPRRKNSKHRN